jgi:hypothetical protein
MNPIELIDKKLQDDKSLLRLAMAMKFAMLMAEEEEGENNNGKLQG